MNTLGTAAAETQPLRVAVHPGAGVVDRNGDVLLVIPTVRPGQWGRVQQLLELLHRVGATSGHEREQALVMTLEQAGDERLPGLALLLDLDAEPVLLAYGEVEITVDGPERQRLRGSESWPWRSHRVRGSVHLLRVLATGAPEFAALGLEPFDLRSGTVPGSGVTLHRGRVPTSGAAQAPQGDVAAGAPQAAIAAEAQQGDVAAEAQQGDVAAEAPQGAVAAGAQQSSVAAEAPQAAVATGPPQAAVAAGAQQSSIATGPPQATVARKVVTFASVLVSEIAAQPQAPRPPLPIDDDSAEQLETLHDQDEVLVDAVECPAGHLNDPESERCASCGATLGGSSSGQLVRRPRPALGVLVTDAGSVFALTGDYVIGRSPERDDAVLSGRAKPLVLRDVGQSVSRVHAQLQITGWRVLVTDRGSANGTFLSRPGPGAAWERLAAGAPTVLPLGARLRIGGRQLLFESYREEAAGRAGRS